MSIRKKEVIVESLYKCMTEVEFRGVKKIVILEDVMFETVDEFLGSMVQGVSPDAPVSATWAEGVVFASAPMSTKIEHLAKKYAEEGIAYWANVKYARMDEYQEEKTRGVYTIKINKAMAPAIVDVAKALRKRIDRKNLKEVSN